MCNCIEKFNKYFADQGKDMMLETVNVVNLNDPSGEMGVGLPISFVKRSTGGRIQARSDWAIFCPFCGERWQAFDTPKAEAAP